MLRSAESEVLLPKALHEMKERKPHLESAEFAGVGPPPAPMSADRIGVVKEFLLRA